MVKGRAEGRAEGKAEGKEEGKAEERANAIIRMRALGFTEEQVRKMYPES